jgi:SAM-dependent methyltransferase
VVVSDALAVVWHDLECGSYTADLPLWRELAQAAAVADANTDGTAAARAPGTVLDVGAGSGRVALELARAGHHVTALDLDAALLEALRGRAAGMRVETVCADARTFELDRRDFALCVAPMQTVQLLGGAAGRLEFLGRARAHLRGGGVLACAIATEIEPFDCRTGELGPAPEIARIDGVTYVSRPTRVRVGRRAVQIERERSVLAGEEPASGRGRAGVRDVVELDRVGVGELQREGREAGLEPAGTRLIPETDEHTSSVAVMFSA